VPDNYFPGDDPATAPLNSWRGHGHMLYANWINAVYQKTPADIAAIGSEAATPEAARRKSATA
jgi:homoserine O-succinyltransferase